ncbi:MAG: cupin domain-containing protein [Dehalococcoidia bacterium]|nr:cupin domain-containing protein [Dehalococcoidia bacterium]
MVEKTSERKREPEPQENLYEQAMKAVNDAMQQRMEGKIVIKGKDCDFAQNRQGFVKYLLHRKDWPNVGTPGWHIFINQIQKHSGKHNHQGGLVIYVIEGEGYTVVDGVRYDWVEGDLIVLPIKPDGCDHQHYNTNPDKPAEWLAFVFYPMWEAVGVGMVQKEEHPDWAKGTKR